MVAMPLEAQGIQLQSDTLNLKGEVQGFGGVDLSR